VVSEIFIESPIDSKECAAVSHACSYRLSFLKPSFSFLFVYHGGT